MFVQSVSDRHKKDWYKQMYNAIHKPISDNGSFSDFSIALVRIQALLHVAYNSTIRR